MHKLPAGKYFIGDPCYVFTDADWDALLEALDSFESDDIQHHNGFELWAFGTAFGDGVYTDQNGIEYPVDSGLLGIVPLEMITNPEGQEHGTVIEFQKPVAVDHENGTFWFGQICIKTNDVNGYDDNVDGYDDADAEEIYFD